MDLQRIHNFAWRIPKHGKMHVDGIVYASKRMLEDIMRDEALSQVVNVACLPGIVGASLAMPDIHWGYGFPIGGVAAFDADGGVVSPGGVGYDINCGVRLLKTELTVDDIAPKKRKLVDQLFFDVPSGVGSHNSSLKLSDAELSRVFAYGAGWAVKEGLANSADLNFIEARGCIAGADPDTVSKRARQRGAGQLGTLGSGNHFVEIDEVVDIYDETAAATMGLFPHQVTITIHTGSRGLGHQVCEDNIDIMLSASRKFKIDLPDKQLCCAPLGSKEGRDYLAAMACAANFAFVNRTIIAGIVEKVFEKVLQRGPSDIGISPVYDVCHNIAKFEEHMITGRSKRLCVHRKGATRAFPAGYPELPSVYREIGQPVLIPGDMGRYSFVLVGTDKAMQETFGSTCHGAGRLMSRHAAKRASRGRNIESELAKEGIIVRGASNETITEEMPQAYKDVAEVVAAVEGAGISKKVARLKPMGVIKG